jgi:hypothetical protein
MRPGRLIGTGLTAALALVAAAPAMAGSFHHKHSNPAGTCAVSASAAPATLTAGETVAVFGRLRCLGATSAADVPVGVFVRTAGAGSFTEAQTTSTDSQGFYSFTFPDVTASSRFYVRSHGAASGMHGVRVAAQVTLSGPAEGTQLLTGRANRVTFTGAVTPADAGARVILQRQDSALGNQWHRIGAGVVQAGGSYSIVHTFVVPSDPSTGGLGEAGDASIRTLVRSGGRNVASPSNVLEYEISQAQNPRLTLLAAPDPISYGQSLMLTGVVAGGSNVPVTLLARSAHQQGFAPIAEVTSDSSGGYAFPAEKPLVNTFYEARSAGGKSAVVYEGVRDVLTVQLSTTTVQAGQALTFSGTVSPQHVGHVIYLERENSSGTGFHVVQIASVGAGSAYTIDHTVYETGTKVFRVRIPGGPENGGAASQTLPVQVTPAPAAALTPEAPGNSLIPAEGQV